MDEVCAHVVLPSDLVQEIDRVAGRRHRSRFLAEAAREKLARLHFEDAAARAFASWSDGNHPDLMTDEDMSAYLGRLSAAASRRLTGHGGLPEQR